MADGERRKNPGSPDEWFGALTAHSLIHAGGISCKLVYVILMFYGIHG